MGLQRRTTWNLGVREVAIQSKLHSSGSEVGSQDDQVTNMAGVSEVLSEIDAKSDDVTSANPSLSQELKQGSQDLATKKKGIDWDVWRKRSSLKLWEAAALSKNIAPSRLARIKEKYPARYKNYRTRLKTAISWLNVELSVLDHPGNGFTAEHKMVGLIDFVKCAEKKQVKMPQQLLDMFEVQANGHESQGIVQQIQTKKTNTNIELRNIELQKAANAMAQDLKKSRKGKITKPMVAQALHKGEWSHMGSIETIKRNFQVDW